MTNKKTPVGILGAGISGLTIAYVLKKKGIPVTVYEQSGAVGGVIQTHKAGNWLVEKGPNTLLIRSESIWNLLDELHLTEKKREANRQAQKRYIVKDGVPKPLPTSLLQFLKTDLISGRAKLRLLKEPFIPASQKQDQSIADFITHRLGEEILNYAVNPFISGIYAGDPKQLSIAHTFSKLHRYEQNHGSITKGFLKRDKQPSSSRRALISFEDGMQTLPRAMAESLGDSVALNHEIIHIDQTGEAWELTMDTPGGKWSNEHTAVISTLPTHRLQLIVEDQSGDEPIRQFISRLEGISYAPMSVLSLGFRRKQVHHPLDGFGMLIPEAEGYQTLGTLFSSSLFPGRAPREHVLLTSFIGGARNRKAAKKPAGALTELVLAELDELLGISGTPVCSHHTYWQNAIPQYQVGYDSFLETMNTMEEKYPGFFLAGNYRAGVSVPDRITSGFETAERVALLFKPQNH